MIFIHLDKQRGKGYLYQQIYNSIKQAILKGSLQTDDKLPSKRDLANNLDVSLNTVSNAYEQLLAEGYIYAIERSGFYIEDIAPFSSIEEAMTVLPEDLKEQPQSQQDTLSFSHMATDVKMFPFTDWKKCQQMTLQYHKEDLAHISHHQGPYLVRETIAKLVQLTRGVTCTPEQIVISSGTQPLVQQIIKVLQETKEQTIAMEDPGYARLYRHIKQTGANIQPVQLDECGVEMNHLREIDPDMVIVTPSHQFPMGMIMPISRRIELLNWANEQANRYIIEDDYDSEFKYETDQIPSLQSLDRKQNVIYIGTFSKSMLTGLRISYMVLPIPLLRKYRETYSHMIPYNNLLSLYTLHYFIEDGYYSRHIKRMNIHYEAKRQQLIDALAHQFGDSLTIENIPAGLHFVAHFKTDQSYEAIEKAAIEENLEIYTIRRFSLSTIPQEKGVITIIIGFATLENSQIELAVERLYKVIEPK